MPESREPAASITEVYDALVSAGVPDREARRAAEAVAARAAAAPSPEDAGAAVAIWRTLVGLQGAAADRLLRLRAVGSALVALCLLAAVALFAAFPDARLLVGPRWVHVGAAPLAFALAVAARQAASDRRERRRLAAAREEAERFEARVQSLAAPAVDPRALLGRRTARPGAGVGADLFYLAEAAILCALLFLLVEA